MRQLDNPASSLPTTPANSLSDALEFLKAFLRDPNATSNSAPAPAAAPASC